MDYALTISTRNENYGYVGHNVYLAGVQIGWRPYDGSDDEEIAREVAETLGSLIRRNSPGWLEKEPEEYGQ